MIIFFNPRTVWLSLWLSLVGEDYVFQSQNCPKGFTARRMLADMFVCIGDSDGLEDLAAPFGGFFSCQRGKIESQNPFYAISFRIQGETLQHFMLLIIQYCILLLAVLFLEVNGYFFILSFNPHHLFYCL